MSSRRRPRNNRAGWNCSHGDPVAAERELRRDFVVLEEMGERYFLSTAAGELARAIYAQGRYAEAEELTQLAEELSADDDLTSQALWRSVRAKTLARRGVDEDAEQLARKALELLKGTDALILQADALEDMAHVLELVGERRRSQVPRRGPGAPRAKGTTSSPSSACERRWRRWTRPPPSRA